MSTDALIQPTVKAALDALQRGDGAAWSAAFEPDAALYDDGTPQSLEAYSAEIIGNDRFERIESVSEDGLVISGEFQSKRQGKFLTFFRFQLSPSGKIQRLDIGQGE